MSGRSGLDSRASGGTWPSRPRCSSEIETLEPEAAAPTHVVTVYGADHVGIVHAVGDALAKRAINITDLYNAGRSSATRSKPLYVMMLEVALPPRDLGAGARRGQGRHRASSAFDHSRAEPLSGL